MGWLGGTTLSRIKKEINALRGLIERQENTSRQMREKLDNLEREVGDLEIENADLTKKGLVGRCQRLAAERTASRVVCHTQVGARGPNQESGRVESVTEPDMDRI